MLLYVRLQEPELTGNACTSSSPSLVDCLIMAGQLPSPKSGARTSRVPDGVVSSFLPTASSNKWKGQTMTNAYRHFDTLRDAKATLAQQFGSVEVSFFRCREGLAIYRLRCAGNRHFFATLYEGPDCYLMVNLDS